jgi:hypothetical protein
VKRAIITIPVRKPANTWYVRTHPSKDYRLPTRLLEFKEDREIFLVAPALWPDLEGEVALSPRLLIPTINRQGVFFLWPVRLPNTDGRVDEWSKSALEAANLAQTKWVRVAANMGLGAYDPFVATGQLTEPEWPTLSLNDILRVAFKDKYIGTADHPALKKLRGEV